MGSDDRSKKNRSDKKDDNQCLSSLDIAWGIVLAFIILFLIGWFLMVLAWTFYGDSWSNSWGNWAGVKTVHIER